MTNYTAIVEVANKEHHDKIDAQAAIEKLLPFDGVLGQHARGWWSATITVPADSLAQATTAAIALVEAAYSCEAIACEVMPFDEWNARRTWPKELPELVSVTEAAVALGVSRQRVLQRINEKTLPATKIGRDYGIPRSALGGG